ncbi:hypothetical protein [Mycobacterium sp.]|uniref:hypothetical protein n=1 Tax=Mycobacterium sp. TaxID=1785 RepID=UPI002D95BFC6|nr:hypothetical protein [Mycobacterium sp.]
MKSVKVVTAMATLAAAAAALAPPAHAMMQLGNYDVLTNRYTQASWFWFVTRCASTKTPDCVYVSAAPRLKFYAYYEGKAHLENGRYTLTVDVPDGLRCPGYNMPTRDTYSWDEVTLAGTIDSVYDVGCFNGPPGSQFWTFALQRL